MRREAAVGRVDAGLIPVGPQHGGAKIVRHDQLWRPAQERQRAHVRTDRSPAQPSNNSTPSGVADIRSEWPADLPRNTHPGAAPGGRRQVLPRYTPRTKWFILNNPGNPTGAV